MKNLLFILVFIGFSAISFAQNIAITDDDTYTANSSAMLDIKSTTKGMLIPRVTTAQRAAIVSPATGLLVFDTSLNGFYYYNGSTWINLSSGSSSGLLWSYTSPNVYLTTSSDKVGIGTSSPAHKLHVADNVSVTDGTDGSFIDIQNTNNTTDVLSGIRFYNGTTATTYKGGIFYQDKLGFGRGDMIFANNPLNSAGNVCVTDARLTIRNTGGVEVKATSEAPTNSAIFHVLNSVGDTVFAVYDGGVRVNVYDDPSVKASGSKGGFAVGGFSPSKGTFTNDYLRITPDSVRIYIDETPGSKASGSKGGFAVGGFSPSKITPTDFMKITADTTGKIDPSMPRILFYPNKNSFFSGQVLIESKDSVGSNSMAIGYESKSIGNYSAAIGYKPIARGEYSLAIGKNALASGDNSFAFGDYAKAIGEDSYAIGSGAIAQGNGSFAFGSAGRDMAGVLTGTMTTASGESSIAFGLGCQATALGAGTFGGNNTASGIYSLAMGYGTIASGEGSYAIGAMTTASGRLSCAMGILTTASGEGSNAFGYETMASGDMSVAMGDGSMAVERYAVALGDHTLAADYAAFAMGRDTRAFGGGSVAFGGNTTAIGQYSLALGSQTLANGFYSIASGNLSVSNGMNSVAFGDNTNAKAYSSLVIGRFNDTTVTQTWSHLLWEDADPLFIIGNGTDNSTRNNAMTVLKNGNVGINTKSPLYQLHVVGSPTLGTVLIAPNEATYNQSSQLLLAEDNDYTYGMSMKYDGSANYMYIYGMNNGVESGPHVAIARDNGNFGLGITAPSRKLDVNGTARIGANGTTITNIIKATVTKDLPSIAASTSSTQTFAVTNAAVGSTVYVSPANALTDGLEIAYARVSAAGTVEVKFRNVSAAAIDMASMSWYITVIE